MGTCWRGNLFKTGLEVITFWYILVIVNLFIYYNIIAFESDLFSQKVVPRPPSLLNISLKIYRLIDIKYTHTFRLICIH